MKYEWEESTSKAIKSGVIPENQEVIAYAVANHETGEAALIIAPNYEPVQGVTEADYWQDIYGDAQEKYSNAVRDALQNSRKDKSNG